MKSEQQKYFYLIRDLILKYGERFPKKHGEWIKLQFTNDLFFEMDSWDSAIWLTKGITECDYWNGFNGEAQAYLGLDFGGLEIKYDADMLKFWYKNLLETINE
jgi:hypothetical protein